MYNKIVVTLDGSELAECVLSHVEAIAQGCGVKEVVLLRVVEPVKVQGEATPNDSFWEGVESKNREEAEAYLNDVASGLKVGGAQVKPVLLRGEVADTIAEYLAQNDVDLVAISTHGRSGISRWIYGSIADRILRSSCVPVLMIRAPGCKVGI